MKLKIVGLDIGRNSAVVCAMAEQPIDLVEFIRKYKPITLTSTAEAIKQLCELGDIFALEPTGTYHRWWVAQLEAMGKQVLMTPGTRIRNHARDNGITSKGDREDAAVIANYCLTNLARGNLRAFQAAAGNEVRDARSGLLTAQKKRNSLICQLKARLAVEAPDLCQFKPTERAWGKEAPLFWSELGNDIRLSWLSREDIEQIIYWENRERRIEQETEQILSSAEYQPYQQKLSAWGFSLRQLVPIIGAIHPVEQFLNADGSRIVERLHTAKGNRVKLDRSMRGIHRSLGYGRTKIQSGDSWKWARTGDRTVLSALYIWFEMKVVIRRTPTAVRLAKVWDLPPEFEKFSKKKRKAWIDDHNFKAFCLESEPKCDAVKPIPVKDRQRVGYMPWKDAELVTKVCSYSGCSEPVAKLQLYYEFAFFEFNKHDRILKSLPYMIRLLCDDLIGD